MTDHFYTPEEETYYERRRKKRRSRHRKVFAMKLFLALILCMLIYGTFSMIRNRQSRNTIDITDSETAGKIEELRPDLDVELLDPNEYSRPQIALQQVNGIVIHYTANPGTTAMANRNYFNNLAQNHETHASSHFIVGLEGEIVQCIPCSEIAYASNNRNSDTISIECCIEDDTGKFNDDTYQSAIELTAWLMVRYGLTIEDVIRHFDITGKNCPKYFVEHEDAWEQFRQDVQDSADILIEKITEE